MIAIRVPLFCSLSGFTLPIHSWKAWFAQELSLIKKVFDSYSGECLETVSLHVEEVACTSLFTTCVCV